MLCPSYVVVGIVLVCAHPLLAIGLDIETLYLVMKSVPITVAIELNKLLPE